MNVLVKNIFSVCFRLISYSLKKYDYKQTLSVGFWQKIAKSAGAHVKERRSQ